MIVAIPLWSAGIINQSRELGFTGPVFAPMMGDIHILNAMLNPKYASDVFHGGADVLSPKDDAYCERLSRNRRKTA